MSSFVPEGGCYELLTIIGNVQGLHDLYAPGWPQLPSTSVNVCPGLAAEGTGGDRTGSDESPWIVFLQVWEKRSCYQEESSCNFFFFTEHLWCPGPESVSMVDRRN